MPAAKKKIPRASRAKRMIHAFYLIQPILQFLVLVLMIGILSRCSPLAPSADRIGDKIAKSELIVNNSGNDANLADEAQSKELSNDSVRVIKESLFTREARDSLRSEEQADEAEVRNVWRSHSNGNPIRHSKIITIALSDEQKTKLWTDGNVHIDLADYTRKFIDERGQRLFLKELKKNHENLDISAEAFVVVPDAAFQTEYTSIEMKIKVSLSMPAPDKAVLIVKRNSESDAEPVLDSALHDAKVTAIVLE